MADIRLTINPKEVVNELLGACGKEEVLRLIGECMDDYRKKDAATRREMERMAALGDDCPF